MRKLVGGILELAKGRGRLRTLKAGASRRLRAAAEALSPELVQARALDEALLAEARGITEGEMREFLGLFRRLWREDAALAKQDPRDWEPHHVRLVLSMKWLRPLLGELGDAARVLEMGGESIVTRVLRTAFKRVELISFAGDLRHRWPLEDDSVDAIVSMEVIEHLADVGEGIQHSFEGTGTRRCLAEAFRVLKPGAPMFVSTPNAGSISIVLRALQGRAPWAYEPHVREYVPFSVLSSLQQTGFLVERWSTVHCFAFGDGQDSYERLFKVLIELGLPTEHRGDELFVVARKPRPQEADPGGPGRAC